VLPTSKPTRSITRMTPSGHASVGRDVPTPSTLPEPADPLRPIGPERLQALREAIRNGTYPTAADVLGGVERLLDVS